MTLPLSIFQTSDIIFNFSGFPQPYHNFFCLSIVTFKSQGKLSQCKMIRARARYRKESVRTESLEKTREGKINSRFFFAKDKGLRVKDPKCPLHLCHTLSHSASQSSNSFALKSFNVRTLFLNYTL